MIPRFHNGTAYFGPISLGAIQHITNRRVFSPSGPHYFPQRLLCSEPSEIMHLTV